MPLSTSLRYFTAALIMTGSAWGQSNVDFSTQVNPIFQVGRAGCSAGGSCHGNGAGGLTLSGNATENYDAIFGKAGNCGLTYITPNSLNGSFLYVKISSNPSCGLRMPQNNPNYFETNQNELALIRVWIEEGALASVPLALAEALELLPAVYSLGANYPNPFNPSTTITYDLPAGSPVVLAVYDLQGRQVAVLEQGYRKAGRHSAVWQGRNRAGESVGSGIYLYRLQTSRFTAQGKMVLLK